MCRKLVPRNAHVDHIKPRIQFPELAMAASNLQVLCEHCHNSVKRTHEVRANVPHGADGFPIGSAWSTGEGDGRP